MDSIQTPVFPAQREKFPTTRFRASEPALRQLLTDRISREAPKESGDSTPIGEALIAFVQ
jgi:hypothetical protein